MASSSGFIGEHSGQNPVGFHIRNRIVQHFPGILKLAQTAAHLTRHGMKELGIGSQSVQGPAGYEQRLEGFAMPVSLGIGRFRAKNPILLPLKKRRTRHAPMSNIINAQLFKNGSLKGRVGKDCLHCPSVPKGPAKSISQPIKLRAEAQSGSCGHFCFKARLASLFNSARANQARQSGGSPDRT
jgi:hypothetical protein